MNRHKSEAARIHKEMADYDGANYDRIFCDRIQSQIGNFRSLSADYKEFSESVAKKLIKTFSDLGCTVIEDPRYKGTDTYGYLIFSEIFETSSKE